MSEKLYLIRREVEAVFGVGRKTLEKLVPSSTLRYLMSPEAEPVLKKLRGAGEVVHY